MAHRYWRMSENMGYAGTDSYEDVDAVDYLNISEKELAAMKDSEVEEILSRYAYEQACEKVDAWAEPIEKEDME